MPWTVRRRAPLRVLTYDYVWTARGSTADTDLLIAGTDGPTPTFAVPDEVNETTTYEYLLDGLGGECESPASADDNRDGPEPGIACGSVRGSGFGIRGFGRRQVRLLGFGRAGGFLLMTYAWTARGSTGNTSLLTGTETLTPTFSVPDDIPGRSMDTYKEIYEYRLTVSVEGIDDVQLRRMLRRDVVLEKPDIRLH